MGENILSDVGIQEALTGNQGIHRTEQYPHIFAAQLWRQILQEHPLYMKVLDASDGLQTASSDASAPTLPQRVGATHVPLS